ncbi:MAG: hypothetical protein J6K29_03930 [Clostridia bacterium]|nr:hypothetical protein [Clostridia bacterium]
MKKNYMKPAAQGVRFSVNENIASSGSTIILEGLGQVFRVPAKEINGVWTAYIPIPEGYGNGQKEATGTTIEELARSLINAGLTYDQYMEVIMGYVPVMVFKS